MFLTVLYFLTLVCITLYCYAAKTHILSRILLTVYTGSAFFAVLGGWLRIIDVTQVTLLPYLFLIAMFIIYMWPFISLDPQIAHKQVTKLSSVYTVFATVYIVCALLTLQVYLPEVYVLIRNGGWSINRNLYYAGEIIFPDANIISHGATLFVMYFGLLAILVGFLMICNSKHKLLGTALLVSNGICNICTSMYTASRGAIAVLMLLYISFYLFFYNQMGKYMKKMLTFLIVLALLALIPFFVEVTTDRFSSWGALRSVVDYLGQPAVSFNDGVFYIDKVLWGKFAFGKLFGVYNFSSEAIGGRWGYNFFTFVGWLYIDWWIVGSFLWGMLLNLFWMYYRRRKAWRISDLFLLFCYYNFLLRGVFVIGRKECYGIVSFLFIYFVIKIFIERKKSIL